jgi:3-phosphoshikimate 1-carboxyvinyltransferase
MGRPDDVVEARHAPGGVAGTIRVPASKSLTQRALLAAALAGGGSNVRSALDADDPRLLFEALRKAGFRLSWEGEVIAAQGRDPVEGATLLMGDNGTGMRFLLAQIAALPGTWDLDGSERLRRRPVAPLVAALRALGAEIGSAAGLHDALPLRVHGRPLRGGRVELDASGSSQFVSALLLLGASLADGVEVCLPAPPPSRPYAELTVEILTMFGAHPVASVDGRTWSVRGGGLAPAEVTVEGDWSAAAFPMAAAAVAGGEVEVVGVRRASRQGDVLMVELLARAGCRVAESLRGVIVRGPATAPIEANLRDTPDLFPPLAVVVAVVGGRLTGLAGLAVKESDRPVVMSANLAALGFEVETGAGWFAAAPGRRRRLPRGETLDPAADHRVAMACAVAGCVVPGVRISNPGCVAKSWPGFWEAWQAIVPADR